jgi:hypothetical protein
MAYLGNWVRIKGTAGGYPTNDEEKLALWPAGIEIEELARGANYFFAQRDDARKRLRSLFRESPERVAEEFIVTALEKLADNANRKYLALWDLYVGKLKLLTDERYVDPNKYREGRRG